VIEDFNFLPFTCRRWYT